MKKKKKKKKKRTGRKEGRKRKIDMNGTNTQVEETNNPLDHLNLKKIFFKLAHLIDLLNIQNFREFYMIKLSPTKKFYTVLRTNNMLNKKIH